MNILYALGVAAITALVALSGFNAHPVEQNVGATIPTAVALWESSLATAITSSATSMTLTSAVDKAGTTFASSTYAFVIDSGTSQEEMVIANCTATACTGMTRGISPITGTSTVASLQFAHRRGASVKITDGPQLLILSRILNGQETVPNALSYNSHPTFTSDTQLVDKKYADDTIAGLVGTATDSAFGTVKLSVAAASTTNPIAVGDNDTRVSPVSLATVTAGQVAALEGTSGTASSTNKYVTDADTTGTGSVVRNSVISTIQKFGGSGADGALAISSGTTDIDLGASEIFIKNYTSISITGTGALTFSNPHAKGTTVILRSQGGVTVTSSATTSIDLRGMGAAGGGGGSVPSGAGSVGNDSDSYFDTGVHAGGGAQASSAGAGIAGVAVTNPTRVYASTVEALTLNRSIYVIPGSGGGGGGGGETNGGLTGGAGGAGGRGAGSLVIECAGAYNVTGVIDASGSVGVTGGTVAGGGGGGGGGGAGGIILAIYNTLTADSGTYTVSGGAGGAGGTGSTYAGGDGGGGGALLSVGNVGGTNSTATGGTGGAGSAGVALRTLNYYLP